MVEIREPKIITEHSEQEKFWGMLCHLSAFCFFILPFLGAIIGPLVVWLISRDRYPFANQQGKASLNFNISVLIYTFISALLVFLLIGVALLWVVGLLWVVCTLIASIKAFQGKSFKYPGAIPFLK